MTLAIRGDRASSLSLQLGQRTWLLAVASGFGRIGGLTTESALLARLRAECERRARSARFRRAIDHPAGAATAMLAVLTRVNCDLYAYTASHEDYVTAAASLTAVLIVHGRVYAIQAGSTAAYLAHEGEIVALSADDVFDERHGSLLFRALGVAPALDVTISSAALAPGDAIILLGRRARDEAERGTLLAQLEAPDPGDHVLIARFEQEETAAPDLSGARQTGKRPWFARVMAAVAFAIAAVRGR
jgi:hypothetical protein